MSRTDRTKAAPAVPDEPQPELPSLREFTPRAVVDLLFSKAGPSLACADLQRIIQGGSEFVESAAGNAAKVAEGLGCLVAADGAAGAGSFQDRQGVAELLWHMKAHFEALEAMAGAVGWASSELAGRGDR